VAEESLKCWSEQRARISLMAQESLMNPDIPREIIRGGVQGRGCLCASQGRPLLSQRLIEHDLGYLTLRSPRSESRKHSGWTQAGQQFKIFGWMHLSECMPYAEPRLDERQDSRVIGSGPSMSTCSSSQAAWQIIGARHLIFLARLKL